MNTTSSSNATIDRERKMKELKKSLAWVCSTELFTIPLKSIEILKFDLEDDEETKQLKRNGEYFMTNLIFYIICLFICSNIIIKKKEHKRKLEIREVERIDREFELLNEFDKVIERVKSSRAEATKSGNSGVNYSSITEAYRNFKFECDKCRNKVINSIFVLVKTVVIILIHYYCDTRIQPIQ